MHEVRLMIDDAMAAELHGRRRGEGDTLVSVARRLIRAGLRAPVMSPAVTVPGDLLERVEAATADPDDITPGQFVINAVERHLQFVGEPASPLGVLVVPDGFTSTPSPGFDAPLIVRMSETCPCGGFDGRRHTGRAHTGDAKEGDIAIEAEPTGLISADNGDDVRRTAERLYEAYRRSASHRAHLVQFSDLTTMGKLGWDAAAGEAITWLCPTIAVPAGTKITTSEEHAEIVRKLRTLAGNIRRHAADRYTGPEMRRELGHLADVIEGILDRGDDITDTGELRDEIRARTAQAFDIPAEKFLGLPSKHLDAIRQLSQIRNVASTNERIHPASFTAVVDLVAELYRITGNHHDVIDRLDRAHPIDPEDRDGEDDAQYAPIMVPLQHPPAEAEPHVFTPADPISPPPGTLGHVRVDELPGEVFNGVVSMDANGARGVWFHVGARPEGRDKPRRAAYLAHYRWEEISSFAPVRP